MREDLSHVIGIIAIMEFNFERAQRLIVSFHIYFIVIYGLWITSRWRKKWIVGLIAR